MDRKWGLAALLAVAMACTLPAAAATDTAGGVSVDLHHMLPMRDGVELAATIWRPADQRQPLPVVLVMTPYISDETQQRAVRFVRHGYVYVSVDVRGRGSSGGRFTPLYGNGPDGADVIAWLARQPWCDGRVVTRGGSYRGMDQWQVLAEHPPGLAAAVPTAAVYPGWDFPQPKGIFMSYTARWLAYTSGHTGQDNLFADTSYWQSHFVDAYEHGRPFRELADLAGSNRAAFLEWLEHPAYDDYWAAFNPQPADYAAIDVPVLTITGYFDGDQRGALRYYREFMAHAGDAARRNSYLLIGPWDHPGTRHPAASLGGLDFDRKSVLDIDGLHLEFFDWILKHGPRPAALRDRVNYYVMGADEWRHAASLEDLSNARLRLYLSSPEGPADDLFHSGRLVRDLPPGQPPDRFRDDPRVRRPAAELRRPAGQDYLVRSPEAHRPGNLVYTSDPLDAPLTVAGAMTMLANLSLDTPDADLEACVDAILPDGSVLVLGQDVLRARFRNGGAEGEPVVAGTVQPYRFDGFLFTVRELPAGARLRVVLGPLDSPDWQRNYNSGGRLDRATLADARAATVDVHLGPDRPSYLELPIATAAPAAQ